MNMLDTSAAALNTHMSLSDAQDVIHEQMESRHPISDFEPDAWEHLFNEIDYGFLSHLLEAHDHEILHVLLSAVGLGHMIANPKFGPDQLQRCQDRISAFAKTWIEEEATRLQQEYVRDSL